MVNKLINPAVTYMAFSRVLGKNRATARRISPIGRVQVMMPAKEDISGEEDNCCLKVWISVSFMAPVYRNRKIKKKAMMSGRMERFIYNRISNPAQVSRVTVLKWDKTVPEGDDRLCVSCHSSRSKKYVWVSRLEGYVSLPVGCCLPTDWALLFYCLWMGARYSGEFFPALGG